MIWGTLRLLAVVLGITMVGAIAGFVFGDRFARSIAADEACFALNSGERLKHLDASRQAAVIAAVSSAPGLFAQTKEIMQRVKPGCH